MLFDRKTWVNMSITDFLLHFRSLLTLFPLHGPVGYYLVELHLVNCIYIIVSIAGNPQRYHGGKNKDC